MNYWYGLLIGLFLGGALGTIAMGLIAGCRMNEDVRDDKAREYIFRK